MAKASFSDPGQFRAGGIEDGKYTIVGAQFKEFEGREDSESGPYVALEIVLQSEDGATAEKRYGVGSAEYCQPSEDGYQFESVDEDDEYVLSKRSGAGKFFEALKEAGFPMNRLDTDEGSTVEPLEGVQVEIKNVPAGKNRQTGEEYTMPLPIKILSADKGGKAAKGKGGKASAKAEAKGAGKKASSKGKAKAEEVDEDALAAAIAEILEDNDGSIRLTKLASAVFKAADKADAKAWSEKATDPEFLESRDEWEYDAKKKMLSLADEDEDDDEDDEDDED